MIDTTQLTQLISAFRVETEKESISPETVGSLLQNITDLLANASSTTEQQIYENWVMSFNDTMLRIWQEKITLLGVIDTGRLLASPKALPVRADGRFFEVGLSQAFLEYGLWQDYGTGRETPRGNPGDIGKTKRRQRRKWFRAKYYASVMRTKEFLEENLGWQFAGIIADALDKKKSVEITDKIYCILLTSNRMKVTTTCTN
jgi:hypothetical protein